ncbi:DUF748 domain-containing protein [Cellulophaga lytica]|uniref:DUF748 domain-containing protein n=1 Tax=Cellulophaga lytica TaxID=979 RepID=UPI003CE547CC
MTKKKSNILKITIATIVLCLTALLGTYLYAKHTITQHLQYNLPPHIKISYNSININILLGNITLNNIVFKELTKDSSKIKTLLKAQKIAVKNIGYTNLLIHKKLGANKLTIYNPKLTHNTQLNTVEKSNKTKKHGILAKPITIAEFKTTNGTVNFMTNKIDTTAAAKRIFISLKGVTINTNSTSNKLPITYKNSSISAQKLRANLGQFEELLVDELDVKNESFTVKNLLLNTKYTKKELSQKIKTERDYVKLKVPSIHINNCNYSFAGNKILIGIANFTIHKPNLEVYRDKLIADDFSYKPMYSKMLRDLPFNLAITRLIINQGKIAYQEKLEQNITPEKLTFTNLNATISNLQNHKNIKTVVHTNSLLMGKTPLELNWSFNTLKKTDFFKAWGNFKNLDIPSINPFLNTNLRVKAEGDMQRMYFTVSGNKQTALGDLKINYNNFKFKVLKKDRLGVNKLLTKLGNLLIKKDSKQNPTNFRYGEIEVERNTTKSFFNYLWININNGLLDALTGKGTKKE